MNLPAAKKVLLLFFLCLAMEVFAQPCQPGQAPCGVNNTCKDVADCGGAPPPPGLILPIDSKIYYLMAAGIGLGIYFMQRKTRAA